MSMGSLPNAPNKIMREGAPICAVIYNILRLCHLWVPPCPNNSNEDCDSETSVTSAFRQVNMPYSLTQMKMDLEIIPSLFCMNLKDSEN